MFYVKVKGVVFLFYNVGLMVLSVLLLLCLFPSEEKTKLKWMSLLQKGIGTLLHWLCI